MIVRSDDRRCGSYTCIDEAIGDHAKEQGHSSLEMGEVGEGGRYEKHLRCRDKNDKETLFKLKPVVRLSGSS